MQGNIPFICIPNTMTCIQTPKLIGFSIAIGDIITRRRIAPEKTDIQFISIPFMIPSYFPVSIMKRCSVDRRIKHIIRITRIVGILCLSISITVSATNSQRRKNLIIDRNIESKRTSLCQVLILHRRLYLIQFIFRTCRNFRQGYHIPDTIIISGNRHLHTIDPIFNTQGNIM